jgi:hypothetical protein
MSADIALTQAEMDYRVANIDLKIQQYLAGSLLGYTVEKFAHFIMATDIGLFVFASVKIISHQLFSAISYCG